MKGAASGGARTRGGLVSKAWEQVWTWSFENKIKQAEECDVTTLRMGGRGQSQRQNTCALFLCPVPAHFLLSSFVHSEVIIT